MLDAALIRAGALKEGIAHHIDLWREAVEADKRRPKLGPIRHPDRTQIAHHHPSVGGGMDVIIGAVTGEYSDIGSAAARICLASAIILPATTDVRPQSGRENYIRR